MKNLLTILKLYDKMDSIVQLVIQSPRHIFSLTYANRIHSSSKTGRLLTMTDETKDPTPNAQRPTPNAQRPTPNAQRPTPNAQAVDPSDAAGSSRRAFLKGLTATAASVTAAAALSTASQQPASANSLPPSTSSPGSPLPWQPSVGLGHGSANLACGNGQFTIPVCAWGG